MQWQWQQRSKWALAVTASLAGNADLFCVTRDSAVRYIIYPHRNICVLSKFYLHRDPLKSKGYAAHTDLFPQGLKRPVKRSICRASRPRPRNGDPGVPPRGRGRSWAPRSHPPPAAGSLSLCTEARGLHAATRGAHERDPNTATGGDTASVPLRPPLCSGRQGCSQISCFTDFSFKGQRVFLSNMSFLM